MRAQTSPVQLVFFVSNTRQLFGDFPTASFYHNWPRHVNSCPIKTYWKGFFENFLFVGYLPLKTPKLQGVKQASYSD